MSHFNGFINQLCRAKVTREVSINHTHYHEEKVEPPKKKRGRTDGVEPASLSAYRPSERLTTRPCKPAECVERVERVERVVLRGSCVRSVRRRERESKPGRL